MANRSDGSPSFLKLVWVTIESQVVSNLPYLLFCGRPLGHFPASALITEIGKDLGQYGKPLIGGNDPLGQPFDMHFLANACFVQDLHGCGHG